MKWPWYKRSIPKNPEDRVAREKYLDLFKEKILKNCPIDQLTFVVLDTETSGLDISKDTILSVAAVKITNGEIIIHDRLECYIKDGSYSPDQSIEVHGITRNQIKEGYVLKQAIRQLIDFIGNAIIVGHHIAFDVKMIDKYVQKQMGCHLKNRTLDTSSLNHRLENNIHEPVKPISLDRLAVNYGVPLGKRHTAAADTFITATIFLKMLNRLKKRGVDNYTELCR
ncbi:MAG: 3'-5' exonuclease [Saprospiraceae bacterium]|nr:3'-5' exonuclease [Saprospiraceae bacterium]